MEKRRENEEGERKNQKNKGPSENPPPHALLTLFTPDYKYPLYAFPFEGGAAGPSTPRYMRSDFISDLTIARHPQIHSPRSLKDMPLGNLL